MVTALPLSTRIEFIIKQAVVLLLDDCITFTRNHFQAFSVDNRDDAAAVLDELLLL